MKKKMFGFFILIFIMLGCIENRTLLVPITPDMNEINDTNIVSPTTGQYLGYDSGLWKNVSGGGGGSGDVTGPASAIDNSVCRFDGITGKVIQQSGVIIQDNNLVGIGTLNPASALDIRQSTDSNGITITTANGGRKARIYMNNNDDLYFNLSAGNISFEGGRMQTSGTGDNQGIWSYRFKGLNSNSYLDFYRLADATKNYGLRFFQGTDFSTAGKSVYLFDDTGTAGRQTASSGIQNWMSLEPTIAQSGTAGYTALNIDATETSTGSGTKNLLDLKIGGTRKFTVTNAGDLNVGTIHGMAIKENVSTGNLLFGNETGNSLTTGTSNVLIGKTVGRDTTTGHDLVGVGISVLKMNTTGYDNTGVGGATLTNNLTGYSNTAVGNRSQQYNETGIGNVSVGVDSLGRNTAGNGNTAVGGDACWWNQGHGNSCFGTQTLWYIDSGSYNVAIGQFAGTFKDNNAEDVVKTVNNSTFIGNRATVLDDNIWNATAIGYQAVADKNNQMVFGNTSIDEYLFPAGTIKAQGDVNISGKHLKIDGNWMAKSPNGVWWSCGVTNFGTIQCS